MDIESLVGGEPQGEITTPPTSTETIPSVLENTVKALQDEVSKTRTQLDDMVAAQKKAVLINEYNSFKSSVEGFDEAALFGALEEKYNSYVQDGATPQQAQALVDKVFQNTIGWKALWSEIQMKSEPKPPAEILPAAGAFGGAELPMNRTGLGKILNMQGAK